MIDDNNLDTQTVLFGQPAEQQDFERWVSEMEESFSTYGGDSPPNPPVGQDVPDEPSGDETPESSPAPLGEPAGEPESPDAGEPPETPVIRIGEADVPVDELRRYYEFGKQLEQIKPVAQTPPPPAFAPDAFPEGWDESDARLKLVWDKLQEANRRSFEARQIAESSHNTQLANQARSDVAQAMENFQKTYSTITAEDIQAIRFQAGQLIPGLLNTHPNTQEAMGKALYIAALDNETTRNKILNITPPKTSAHRKRQQSSLAGTSGSVPRTPPAPNRPASTGRLDNRSHTSLVNDIAEDLKTNWDSSVFNN
jgi:hypothetical protein